MNKVEVRCTKESCAKFFYASKGLFFEVKAIKVILYLLAIIPIAISFIPMGENVDPAMFSFACSIVSFALTIVTELLTTFLNNHKEKAILEHQLYEAEITGSTFSKIEYDRESTNELHELAIRKGLPKMKNIEEYNKVYVTQQINDDYSYLYLCRRSAASNRFILSRIFHIYFFFLMCIVCFFIGAMFIKTTTTEYLTLIIGIYPLVNPFINDCAACKKSMKICAKICADIDNYFADGDSSIERLARFYYYVQNIEFEMMLARPAIFEVFNKVFRKRTDILTAGVTTRFIEAIAELKGRSLMYKGVVAQPKGKGLITRVDIDIEELEKKAIKKASQAKSKTPSKPALVEENEMFVAPKTPKPRTTSPAATKPATAKTTTTKPVVKPIATTKKPTTAATTKKAATAKTTTSAAVTKPATKTTKKTTTV